MSDITGDINLTKLVNLDLGGKILTGNVNISSDATGTLNIFAGKITGNLTVDTKEATVNNNATVTGQITIEDVSNNTWNELVSGNKLVFKAEGKTLHIADDAIVGSLEINATATVISSKPVTATIKADVVVTVKADEDDAGENVTGTGEPVEITPPVVEEEVNIEAIDRAITAANEAKEGVLISEDGTGVAVGTDWVTKEVNAALILAMETADIAKDTVKNAAEVEAVAAKLLEAVEVYTKAKKDGTKEETVVVNTDAYDAIVKEVPANNDDGKYTSASWGLFETAIEATDLALTAEAGQEALDAEVIKIQEALDLLVLEDEEEVVELLAWVDDILTKIAKNNNPTKDNPYQLMQINYKRLVELDTVELTIVDADDIEKEYLTTGGKTTQLLDGAMFQWSYRNLSTRKDEGVNLEDLERNDTYQLKEGTNIVITITATKGDKTQEITHNYTITADDVEKSAFTE